MIHRYAEEKIDLQQVKQDLEGALEQPEAVENSFTLKDFSQLEFQFEYEDDDRYTAVTEEYTIHVSQENSRVKVETGKNQGEDSYLKQFIFGEDSVELPDRPIGGRGSNPIESALRNYACQLYPEKQESSEEHWSMDHPGPKEIDARKD